MNHFPYKPRYEVCIKASENEMEEKHGHNKKKLQIAGKVYLILYETEKLAS